ncbi:hypothetical protein D3C73_1505480 [compost metagenome]
MQQYSAGFIEHDNAVQRIYLKVNEILKAAGRDIGEGQPVLLQLGGWQLLDQTDTVITAGNVDALLAVEQGRGVQHP